VIITPIHLWLPALVPRPPIHLQVSVSPGFLDAQVLKDIRDSLTRWMRTIPALSPQAGFAARAQATWLGLARQSRRIYD
jgi:hypothetical protein